MKVIISVAIGGMFGCFMAYLGYSLLTVEFWIGIGLLVSMQIVSAID